MASFQSPFSVVNKPAQSVTVCSLPVGPKPARFSAANVPVRGAAAPLIGVVDVELITVLVKLSVPLPPVPPLSEPTRLRFAPFGAIRLISRSPTQVWLMLNVTLMLDTTALAGIPLKLIGEVTTPVGKSSGIRVVKAPDETEVVTLADAESLT